MEEMKKVAIACYEKADSNTKQIAKQFFDSIDKDGNGKITQNEFIDALKQLGLKEPEKKELANLFDKFDTNRDKRLDFNEAVAFYYVTKHTPAVFCSVCCAYLLAGVYFSCLECHMKSDGETYDVCVDCYRNGKSDDHEHSKALYDNHHLLHLYRNLRAEEEGATNHKDTATAPSTRRKRDVLKRFVPNIFRTSADPDSADNGAGNGNVSVAGAGLDDAAGGLGSAGVGVAKRGLGLGNVAEHGVSGVSKVADVLTEACSIM